MEKHNVETFKSPIEHVIEIISGIRDKMLLPEHIKNLNYCLKVISSGNLYHYEVNVDSIRSSRKSQDLQKEINSWLGSSNTQVKRPS